jgi:hypothetical protein
VTFNLKDFSAVQLASHGVEAWHPDRFLQAFTDVMPDAMLAVVGACLARLTKPPITAATYATIMRRTGLPETAAFLEAQVLELRF